MIYFKTLILIEPYFDSWADVDTSSITAIMAYMERQAVELPLQLNRWDDQPSIAALLMIDQDGAA